MDNRETAPGIPESSGPPSARRRWISRAILLAIFIPFAATVLLPILERYDGGAAQLRRNISELKAGKTRQLQLVSTRRTDALLEQIRGMPEIEEIILDDVDITVVGMRQFGSLPNLRRLLSYGGVEGDQGLLELRTCKKLEGVAIFDPSITEEAIAELRRHLPKVRVITNHDGDTPGRTTNSAPDARVDETAPPNGPSRNPN